MKSDCCLAVCNHSVRVCNNWATKQTPPSCQYAKAVFNDAPGPTQSVVEYSLVFWENKKAMTGSHTNNVLHEQVNNKQKDFLSTVLGGVIMCGM